MARTYRGASALSGPLLYLERTRRVRLGEWVTIRSPRDGTSWRGQVIDAGEDVTVIQVLEETYGLAPARVEVTLSGDVAKAVVGRELLGRAFNGVGEPVDGLGPAVGEAVLPIWGAPVNPARRLRPTDFIETGISAIDGMNTLVRGQKLPIFSAAGLPAMELAAFIAENVRARGGEQFAVVFVAIGITARETHSFVRRFERSGAMDRTILYLNEASDPTIERLLAPRFALTEAEFLAFERGYH
ncbi:MAG TPA: V-type ATP synthase subunit B, partial [Vicinamibacteria bacterium]|nr:V-type ATP synthase subunit B [Vicinamibacteria bacterium]